MKHLSDANKNKLIAFLRSRAAAGEASLKSWGRTQRPQIPGILVEEIADALVAEGKARSRLCPLPGGDTPPKTRRARSLPRAQTIPSPKGPRP